MHSAKRLELTGVWSSITSSLSSIPEGSKSTFDLKNQTQILFRWLTMILEFLNLPWEEAVLHHEEQINKPGGVRLFNFVSNVEEWDVEYLPSNQFSKVRVSMVERSSDQIIKPINLDALTTWVGTYPEVSDSVHFAALCCTLAGTWNLS